MSEATKRHSTESGAGAILAAKRQRMDTAALMPIVAAIRPGESRFIIPYLLRQQQLHKRFMQSAVPHRLQQL